MMIFGDNRNRMGNKAAAAYAILMQSYFWNGRLNATEVDYNFRQIFEEIAISHARQNGGIVEGNDKYLIRIGHEDMDALLKAAVDETIKYYACRAHQLAAMN